MIRDTTILFRRRLMHLAAYPSLTLMLIGMPLTFLFLFVYVFGGTMGSGIAGTHLSGSTSRSQYLAYIFPAILVMTVAATAQGTAIGISMDMTRGIVDRLRTLPIARSAVLTAHALGALVQTVIGVVVVLGVALALGYRTSASVGAWVLITLVTVAFSLALTWLTIALGLAARSVETASNTPMFLTLLPFLSSGFVPTDSMGSVLRFVAQAQPFTPIVDALRGLLDGHTPTTSTLVAAFAWCAGIALLSFVWSTRLYARRSATVAA